MNMFNDNMVTCPKCGSNELKKEYITGLNKVMNTNAYEQVQPVIRYSCNKCNTKIFDITVKNNIELFTDNDIVKKY